MPFDQYFPEFATTTASASLFSTSSNASPIAETVTGFQRCSALLVPQGCLPSRPARVIRATRSRNSTETSPPNTFEAGPLAALEARPRNTLCPIILGDGLRAHGKGAVRIAQVSAEQL